MTIGKDQTVEILSAAEIHSLVLGLVESARKRGVDFDTVNVPHSMGWVAGWRDGDEIVPGVRVRLVEVPE